MDRVGRRHRHETEGFCQLAAKNIGHRAVHSLLQAGPGQPLVEINTQLPACLLFFYRARPLDTSLASRRAKRPKRDLPVLIVSSILGWRFPDRLSIMLTASDIPSDRSRRSRILRRLPVTSRKACTRGPHHSLSDEQETRNTDQPAADASARTLHYNRLDPAIQYQL
jgi:hypothetical protein